MRHWPGKPRCWRGPPAEPSTLPYWPRLPVRSAPGCAPRHGSTGGCGRTCKCASWTGVVPDGSSPVAASQRHRDRRSPDGSWPGVRGPQVALPVVGLVTLLAHEDLFTEGEQPIRERGAQSLEERELRPGAADEDLSSWVISGEDDGLGDRSRLVHGGDGGRPLPHPRWGGVVERRVDRRGEDGRDLHTIIATVTAALRSLPSPRSPPSIPSLAPACRTPMAQPRTPAPDRGACARGV